MSTVGNWIDRMFNQHKLVRRVLVLWAPSLITVVTLVLFVFGDWTKITGPVAIAYGSVTALLATVIGLYMWSRNKEDK